MLDIETVGIDQKKYRELICKAVSSIKKHHVIKDLFKEYNLDLDEIEIIPICFADIDVSARTDHGCIYLNIKLVEDGFYVDKIDHYLVHEIVHWAQQTTGTSPTKGAEDGEYLENEYEIEGFQNQVEFMADTQDEKAAEEYVEQVLDHHNMDGQKAEDKKEELMDCIAARKYGLTKLLGV